MNSFHSGTNKNKPKSKSFFAFFIRICKLNPEDVLMQTFYSLANKTGVRQSLAVLVIAIIGGFFFASTARGVQGDSDPQGPNIKHVPTTAVVRGAPVNLSAIITPEPGSVLTSQVVLVRLTDAGTPIEHAMEGSAVDNAYSVILPVALIKNINVFWYAIDTRDDQGRIGGTIWYRVVIIDPVDIRGGFVGKGGSESAAAAGLAGGGGGGGGGGLGTAGLVAGGILIVGGAVAIIENQDDDDDDKKDPPEVLPPEESGGRNDDDDEPSSPPVCNGVTGNETVAYENLSLCGSFGKGAKSLDNILILVCYTCPNATISAEGSWEASDQINGFNNPTCSQTAPILLLPKPDGFPTPGTYTITVYANGIEIDQIVWPPLSDFDCF